VNALAAEIQARLDHLLTEYDRRLLAYPAYAALPAPFRRAVARRTLDCVADWLQSGDDTRFVQFIQSTAKEQSEQGTDIGIMHYAVNELEALLQPMITDVEAAKLVWRTLSKARRQISETFLASERQLRQMVDCSPIGLYHTTLGGRLVYANEAFLKTVGYASLEAVNRLGVPNLYQNPADRQRLIAMLQQGPVTGFETDLCRADGQTIAVSLNVRLIREAGAEPYMEGVLVDITERKRAQEEVIRREAILEAVSFATKCFLEAASWEENIDQVLQRLGQATGVSRVCAYENHTGKDGSRLMTTLRYEWVAPGIPPQIDNPLLRGFSWEKGGFGRWVEVMSRGEILHGLVSEFPDRERKLLAERGIRSLVVVPVFAGSTWWGYIGFDDYQTARQWSKAEVNALKAAADGLGAAIRRKRAEEESRTARQQLLDIVDFLPDATFVIDQDKKVIAWNRAAEEMTGTRKENILGQGDYAYAIPFYGERRPITVDLIGAEDSEWKSKYEYVRKQGNTLFTEVFVQRVFGGRGADLWVMASPLLDSQGDRVGAIESIRDITERKRAEAAIRESEERFRSVVENSPTGILIVDNAYKFTYANDELCRIIDYSREDIVGSDFTRFLDEESRQMVADRYVRRQRGEDLPPRYEFNVVRRDGEKRRTEIVSTVFKDSAGNVQTVGQILDITERKRLEDQIRESLVRRGAQVQTSTEVAQEIAAAPELEELFRRVVTLIKERFNYYHAQIFRYDPAQDAVVLVTGYGEAGQRMLAAGHKLAMGRGVVGTAAATGQSILATDTAQDKDWRPNPNLPDTKGELAVPIKLRGEVLGILDVQSSQAGALSQEDQLLLEGLCGQIAVAIEHKRAEEALAQEQYLMRALMDNIPDHIYFKDTQSRFIRINKSQADRFGLSDPAQGIGKSDFDFFREEHARPAYEDEQEIIRTGQPVTKEERETWPDRPDTWVWTTKLPLRDEAGNIVGTFGISTDITERKRDEAALAEERNLMRTLIDTLPDLIYAKDSASRFILANIETARVMGAATPDDLIGKSDFDFYPRELAEQYFASEQPILRDGQPLHNHEEPNVDATGYQRWDVTTKVPLRNNLGQITGLVGVTRDITERKQTEARLAEERNLMRTLIDTLPDLIYAKDTASRFILANIETARVMGVATPEDLIGKSDWDFYPRELAEQYYASEQPILREGQLLLNHEEPNVDAMGHQRWDTTTKVPLRNSQGQIVGLVGVTRDITERKQTDAKMQETLRELERLYRATTREGWQAYRETAQVAPGYLFDRTELKPQDIWLPQIEQVVKQNVLVPSTAASVATGEGRGESVAVAPLSVRGEVIGAVGIYDDPKRPLSPEDLALVQEITEQGALALESARLFEQTQSRARQEQILREVTSLVNASQNLADSLPLIEEKLRGLVPLESLSLTQYTPGERELTVLAVYTQTQTGQVARTFHASTRLPVARSGPGWVITHDLARVDSDLQSEALAQEFVEVKRLLAEGLTSRIILPFRAGGQITGTLNIVSKQPGAFTAAHIDVLQPIADQISLAMERARLLEETRNALTEVEATQRRYLREQWGTYLAEALERPTGFMEGPAGPAAGSDIWLPEMEQALELDAPVKISNTAEAESSAQRAALALPVKLRGESIGVLEFYDEGAPREWSEDEQALVAALADQVALALENARLFEDTQARAQREQMINTITARIRASTDVEAILRTAAEELAKALNLSRARIRLTPGNGRSDGGEAAQ